MDGVANAQWQGWLFGAVAAIAVPAFLFFHLSRNAALKRQLWPPFMIAFGLLFMAFGWFGAGEGDRAFALLWVAMVVLIVVLNIRSMKFCDDCGATQMNQNFLSPPKFCSKCGSELQ